MKPVIAVPSYKRPKAKAIQRLKEIPLDKYLFIRPEDYTDYKDIAKDCGFKIVKLKNVTDIGNTRQKLVQYCNSKGFEWVFMFDDDISKVECLSEIDGKINSARILYEPEESPRFEMKALKMWFTVAKKYKLSLSSPDYRPNRQDHGYLHVNQRNCIQCVLIHIPDIIEVGNYKSLRQVGVEDYEIQFRLMESNKLCATIGSIEYDCPSVGQGSGGNNAVECQNIQDRYNTYIQVFLSNVCNDESKVILKNTISTGIKSIKFNWKSFGGYKIKLDLIRRNEYANHT